jgi:hypothetical protein
LDIEGIVRKGFVPPGKMVNGKFCCDVLGRIRENIRRKLLDKWCNDSWALHHDNAPAYASLVLQHFLASTKKTVIPNPPYSPDIAPHDFFHLSKMKLKLKGRRFDRIEEM